MRNLHADASKGVLIFLVVFGHFLERLIGWNEPINQTLLGSIYFIHMPAFIFISGMLFKDQRIWEKVLLFMSLYLPFQVLFQLLEAFYKGTLWSWNFDLIWFIKPYWVLWYLFGMMAWTVLTYLLKKTPFPVLLSIILALLIGFSPINNYQYSIGRIFVFLPFFVVGAVHGKAIFQYIPQMPYAKLLALLGLGVIGWTAAISHYSHYWLFGSLSYTQLHVEMWQGVLIRSVVLLLSSIGIFGVLVWSQYLKQLWVTLGQKTLPIYLLHGFVIIVLTHSLSFPYSVVVKILISLVLSVLTCTVLHMDIFERLVRGLSAIIYRPFAKLFRF